MSSRDIIERGATRFNPSTHGFQFSNTNIPWRWNGASGRNLCGGMSYASLDYFFNRVRIPQDRNAPPVGTELNTYLLNRQVAAHTFAIPRLIGAAAGDAAGRFRDGLRMDGYFGTIVESIRRETPVPVVMMDVDSPLSTNSHWTVVIGYEIDEAPPDHGGRRCGRVALYDNNYPRQVCYLTPDFEGQFFRHSVGGRYRTYIPDTGFRPRDPRLRPRVPRSSPGLPFY